MKRLLAYICASMFFTGCAVNSHSYSHEKKYAPEQLQEDFLVFEGILEEAHPSLYWYTSKDSMDHYFDEAKKELKDSMNETSFRKILSFVTSKIGCGHTSIRASKAYQRYRDTSRIVRIFPLSLKLWNDTAVVIANLNRKDSMLSRGVEITKINGESIPEITHTLFNYIPTDGYNTTHKYQVLSNRGSFGSMYSSIYGFSDKYAIEYIDSTGRPAQRNISPYYPLSDTIGRAVMRTRQPQGRPSKKERKELRRNAVRLLRIDTTERVAMMDLNNFGRGFGLKGFFRRSFKLLKERDIEYLIIDVRNNGGGSPTNSTNLTRYLSDRRFKIGDSLYAITKKKKYSQYVKGDFFNRVYMTFFTKRKKDGFYHMGYFERHYFKPRKHNHFNGEIYILTGGNSFSATTLFTGSVIDQDNITVVGEETGGGAYGNTAWHMPTVTLPETKVRLTLPLYRLVVDKNKPKTGYGVQPEIKAGPSIEAIRKGTDYKLEKVMELIKKDKKTKAPGKT